ncbi:MAG: hypothetical protein IPN69_05225 [Acidobacteria bacterium]|nr:hypothetical protein [Acidobacteriota bacterium]
MAKRTVKAGVGDSLCNIAYLNGFGDCKPFREEPANAYIVNRAVDPGQVLPGDVVTIPDFVKKDDGGGTEATHQYVRRGTLAKLRFVHGSVSTTVDNDTALTFLNVSNYITNQAGTADGNVAFPNSAVRTFNADADKDADVFKVEVLDINAAGDLDVELEVLKPKYDAAGKVTGHEQFPGAIRGPRQLKPKASKQGSTKRFRTCYLRLVVDPDDKAAAADQTLLASDMHDNGDSKVEILDQKVKASYEIKTCPSNPKCRSTVILPIGNNRKRIRLAINVLRKTPGGDLIVPLADAERRVWTWFRRVYAQANIAPRLVHATRGVDPMENLVSISNDSGLTARGDGRIGFTIHSAGKPDQVVGPITPAAGDTPIKTARALAAKVVAPFKAVASENPARFVDNANRKSADILITEQGGARVTITIDVPVANRDTRQTISIGVVNPMNLESWAVPNGNNNWNAGSLQQRTVLKNFDSKDKADDDTVDIFVVEQLTGGNRGEAMMSNHRIDPQRASVTKIKWSAFLIRRTMNAGDANPFSFPHEVGHVTAEVVHATGAANQLMTDGGTSGANAVGGSKRIRDGDVTYDAPAGDFNLVRRLRTEGAPLLESW